MTHAFFKALLFLAAGAVIIAMHHEQDLARWRPAPSHAGDLLDSPYRGAGADRTPFFSGFYSKDALIDAVHASTRYGAGYAYWCVLLVCSSLRWYTFRDIFMTFHGRALDHHAQEHFHDVGWDMKGRWSAGDPVAIIGYLTVEPILFGGYFGDAIKVLEGHDVVRAAQHRLARASAFGLRALVSAPHGWRRSAF